MTRGRDANHAYVVIEENETARDVLTQAIGREWIDRPAITHLDARFESPPPHEGSRFKATGVVSFRFGAVYQV